MLSLIDFWKIQRFQSGEICEIRPFHNLIADHLTQLLTGTLDTPNLMILMPPRCAKTDLGVKAFMPYSQSWFPDGESIIASYGSELATASTKHIRNTLSSDWYRSMVGSDWGATVELRGDSATGHQDYFHTTEKGSIKGIGVGGGITGFGAGKLRPEFGGLLVVDDPLKANDANSAAKRKECIDWYHGTLESRKNRKESPITPTLLIMQRLHPQDLAGHLIQTERDKWTVLQIPAHDEEGNTIWPGRISYDELQAMKEANPDVYWSQYMQSPSDAEFSLIKQSWFRYWNNIEEVEKRCTLKFITADTAFKAKDTSDWSVLQLWGVENTSGMYLLDQVRGRWEFPELCFQSQKFWEKHSGRQGLRKTAATEFWIEDKASGTSLVQTLRKAPYNIPARAWLPNDRKTSPDKVGRVNQCALPMSVGRIYFPDPKMAGYKWVEGLMNENVSFTSDDSHLFDDQVDTETMAILIWLERGGGTGPLPIW